MPSVRASGSITIGKGSGKTVRKTYSRAGGMCPHCEGRGTVSDIDLTQLYDDSKSLADGAITIPGYKKGGWAVKAITESGFVDADKPIRDFSEQELADFLYKEPTKVRMMDMNATYEGLIPKVKKSFFSKDRGSMRPHIRAFVDRAATYVACPDCGGTRLAEGGPLVGDRGDQHRRRLRHADQRPGRVGARPRRAIGGAVAGGVGAHVGFVRGDRARAICRSTVRPGRCRAGRRSAPR